MDAVKASEYDACARGSAAEETVRRMEAELASKRIALIQVGHGCGVDVGAWIRV